MAEANGTARLRAIEAITGPGQPHELATMDVAGLRQRVFVNGPITLRDLYEQNLSDQPFLVYEDERLTYAEGYAQAARIAHVLVRDYGIARGDRVAISMRNYPEWILAFKAATSIGAIVVAMNALWQPEELEYGLRDSGARVLIADRERLERLAHCSPDLDVRVIAVRCEPADPKVARLETLLAGVGVVAMPASDVGPEDMALLLYTSGSTGHPKGVPSSHRNIISALLSWEVEGRAAVIVSGVEPPPPANPPAALLAVPLFHVMGTHVVYLSSYRAQRKIVSMYRWHPEKGGGAGRAREDHFLCRAGGHDRRPGAGGPAHGP